MSPRRPQPMLVKAGKFRLSAAFLTMAVSCGGQDAAMESAVTNPPTNPPVVAPITPVGENGDGIEFTGALLTDKCVLTATLMTVTVKDTESAYLTVKDGKYSVNAVTGTSGELPCEIAAPGTVKFTAAGTGVVGRTVILDYANGLFGKATNATPPVVIDMTQTTNSTNDTVKVRGTADADSFLFGAGTGGAYAFNINAGTVSPLDALVDVTFKQVENLIVNGGAEDDVISAAGGTGAIGAVYPLAVSFYGGADEDTLTGGAGNDKFVGGSEGDVFQGSAGNDTVDYSARSAAMTIKTIVGDAAAVVASTDTSGITAGAEGDKISDKIVNIIGGSGVDTITIASTSTVAHNVTGGYGDDVFTGGLGADIFDGGTGADSCTGAKATMTYLGRPLALTVTVGTTANDGYPLGATAATGTFAASGTLTDKRITLQAISGATDTVGRLVTITGSTGNTNDGTYPVVSVNSANSVVLDVSSNASFDESVLTPTAGLTWTFIAEGDDADCGNVTGGSAINTITGDGNANVIRGGALADVLKGGAGNDWVYGGAGNDAIEGGAGADTIFGDADADTIYGGAGDDTINGGAGIDTMYGGDGDDIMEGGTEADVFDCDGNLDATPTAGSAPGEIDTAVDFTSGTDTGTALNCEP
jgi:Ca2+-binding RTX toxin-like protein